MSTKPKIMLIDDDEDILDQLSMILKAQGCEVFTASSQKDGEELMLSVQPDLAILDLMMEQKDSGFVLAHYLKKLYPDVPVVMLTAVTAATGMTFAAATAEGRSWVKADVILDKPVRAEQIRATVARLLGDKAPAETAAGHH